MLTRQRLAMTRKLAIISFMLPYSTGSASDFLPLPNLRMRSTRHPAPPVKSPRSDGAVRHPRVHQRLGIIDPAPYSRNQPPGDIGELNVVEEAFIDLFKFAKTLDKMRSGPLTKISLMVSSSINSRSGP